MWSGVPRFFSAAGRAPIGASSSLVTRPGRQERTGKLRAEMERQHGDRAARAIVLRKVGAEQRGGAAWDPRRKLQRDQMEALRAEHARDPTATAASLAERYHISSTAVVRILNSRWAPPEDRAKEQDEAKAKRRADALAAALERRLSAGASADSGEGEGGESEGGEGEGGEGEGGEGEGGEGEGGEGEGARRRASRPWKPSRSPYFPRRDAPDDLVESLRAARGHASLPAAEGAADDGSSPPVPRLRARYDDDGADAEQGPNQDDGERGPTRSPWARGERRLEDSSGGERHPRVRREESAFSPRPRGGERRFVRHEDRSGGEGDERRPRNRQDGSAFSPRPRGGGGGRGGGERRFARREDRSDRGGGEEERPREERRPRPRHDGDRDRAPFTPRPRGERRFARAEDRSSGGGSDVWRPRPRRDGSAHSQRPRGERPSFHRRDGSGAEDRAPRPHGERRFERGPDERRRPAWAPRARPGGGPRSARPESPNRRRTD
jgi:hypothetical protein